MLSFNSFRKSQPVRTGAAIMFALMSIVVPVLTQSLQPQAVYYQFDPFVIRSDQTQPVLLQVSVTGIPTRVVFEYNPSNRPPGQDSEMRDDGTGGDQRAGDGIYSLTLQASQVVQGLQPDDVFRRFIGYIKLFQDSTLISRINIFAQIFTDEIPRLPVITAAQDVRHTNYLVNIFDPGFYTGVNFDLTRVTKKFYQFFRDDYDFLNIVYTSNYIQNRYHFYVSNNIQGIGLQRIDRSSVYGSAGKLLGITVFPSPVFLEGAESGYQHELGHQWINYLSIAPLQAGIPHWPRSSLAGGIMGWSDPVSRQGLLFPCRLVPESGGIRLVRRNEEPVFADLDLYLMGFLPPEQVGEHIVFADQNQARTLSCNGQLFTGEVVRVKIADIMNVVGNRVPDASSAPKRFNIATIIVSKDGLLNEEAMAFYSFFAKRAEETREVPFRLGFVKGIAKPFAISTGGRGSLNTQVSRTGCAYSLLPTSQLFEISGGAGSVNVTAGSGCNWTATSNAGWITITSGASGSGNGTVNFSVAANMNGDRRSGTLSIAGQTLMITQAGSCAYSLLPTSRLFEPSGGAASVNVTAGSGCDWTATSNVGWITITSGWIGSGNGTVGFAVAANPSTSARTGTLTIAEQTFTVTQAGQNPVPTITSLNPASAPAGSPAFPLTVTGTNFVNGAVVRWKGSARTTAFVSSTQLTASIFAADIGAAGTASVTVFNPGPGGGVSNALNFTITQPSYEADVAPRPNGNGAVTVSDWTQVGRFVAGLDTAANGSEFQRADCAPRSTLGDGRLTAADWTQAGRYAAGQDPVVPAGGPTSPASAASARTMTARAAKPNEARRLRVIAGDDSSGAARTVMVELDAQGDENALGFSLRFNPSQWRFVSAEAGLDARRAVVHVNASEAASGRIGLLLALPAGGRFNAGGRRIVALKFAPVSGDSAEAPGIGFADQPVAREIVSGEAIALPARYEARSNSKAANQTAVKEIDR